MQGRISTLIPCLEIRAGVQKSCDNGETLVEPSRPMQGRYAEPVPCLEIRPGVQERLDDSRILVEPSRPMQGRLAILVPCLEIRPGVQERLDDSRILVGLSRPMQGRPATLIPRLGGTANALIAASIGARIARAVRTVARCGQSYAYIPHASPSQRVSSTSTVKPYFIIPMVHGKMPATSHCSARG